MGPLCIFPEGTMTNGKDLLEFKRGAFLSLLPVQPTILKHPYKNFSHDCGVLLLLPIAVMLGCEMATRGIDICQYPLFSPNDYLFTEYKKTLPGHEKMEKWEVYATAVRDFMIREGGFGSDSQPMREKLQFLRWSWGVQDTIDIKGRTYKFDPEIIKRNK